jgi:hypothetical protein
MSDSTTLTVNAYGGSGSYTYNWSSIPAGFASTLQSPKVAPADTTKYICVTSDGTLTRNDTVKVNVQHMPLSNAGADTIVCWYVTSIDLHGMASNYKALGWTTSGSGTFDNSSQLNTVYRPSQADKLAGSVNLNLVAIANVPCTGNTTSTRKITFDVCTGTGSNAASQASFILQPNPARTSVTVNVTGLSANAATLTIRSLEGKIMYESSLKTDGSALSHQIDLNGYAKGLYIVQLKSDEKVVTQKLNVQ